MFSLKTKLNLTAFGAIIRQEIHRFCRIWVQTLLPPVITSVLYFSIFGNFIGSQVSEINGYTYMEFIVPGLIMLSVITNSYSNVVSSFYSKRFQRSIEALLASPVSEIVILFGYSFGGVARAFITAILVGAVSLLFTGLNIQHIFMIVPVILLTSLLFSFMGIINAVFARNFDDVSIIPTFVLTPLTYLGGVFYSVSYLPETWQTVSKFNPVLYIINIFRYAMLGVSDVNVYVALSVLTAFTILMGSVAYYMLIKGIGLKE